MDVLSGLHSTCFVGHTTVQDSHETASFNASCPACPFISMLPLHCHAHSIFQANHQLCLVIFAWSVFFLCVCVLFVSCCVYTPTQCPSKGVKWEINNDWIYLWQVVRGNPKPRKKSLHRIISMGWRAYQTHSQAMNTLVTKKNGIQPICTSCANELTGV